MGQFTVRCDELCGIWHGAMFDYGQVVTKPAFMAWATATEKSLSGSDEALAAVRLDVRPGRQRGRRRLLPRQRGPLQPRRDLRGAKGVNP